MEGRNLSTGMGWPADESNEHTAGDRPSCLSSAAVSHLSLDELANLHEQGCWPGLSLETVIREVTHWSHSEYQRWAETGRTPGEPNGEL